MYIHVYIHIYVHILNAIVYHKHVLYPIHIHPPFQGNVCEYFQIYVRAKTFSHGNVCYQLFLAQKEIPL